MQAQNQTVCFAGRNSPQESRETELAVLFLLPNSPREKSVRKQSVTLIDTAPRGNMKSK